MAQAQSKNVSQEEARDVRLLGLLLVDALETIARGRRASSAPQTSGVRETRQWVCAREGGGSYSFERACEAFGLPPVALRRRLGLRTESARRTDGRGWLRRPNR